MKRSLGVILALTVSLGAGGAKDDPVFNEIKTLQDKLNRAFEANDESAIKRLMTDDHMAVTSFYDKPLNFADQIKALSESKLTEYSAAAMSFNRLGDDVVQVTYHASLKGTYRGKPIPSRAFVSALWVRRDGSWRESFYQETPLGGH
jgi:hypothetical protein